jgi:hypothetical protein
VDLRHANGQHGETDQKARAEARWEVSHGIPLVEGWEKKGLIGYIAESAFV